MLRTGTAEAEPVTAEAEKGIMLWKKLSRNGESWLRDNGKRVNMTNAVPGMAIAGPGTVKAKSTKADPVEKSLPCFNFHYPIAVLSLYSHTSSGSNN